MQPLKAFFNARGAKYRELDLKNRLPELSEAEQIKLLAGDGMVIRRPMLVGQDKILIGFNAQEWAENLI